MPPPFPSSHRGMTANPLKPVRRYRPGKAVAEEPSSSEEEEEEAQQNEEESREQERRRRAEEQRRRQAAVPKASSFPAGAARGITKGVEGVRIEKDEEEGGDEEGFVTDEEDEGGDLPVAAPAAVSETGAAGVSKPIARAPTVEEEEEEEESEEEESSEEESSSEDEAPRRVLLRPTFIKKDKRGNGGLEAQNGQGTSADSQAETEARKAQRQEKADALVREQIEKDAIARSAANRAWDDDEVMANEEAEIDDTDNKDPEAEYAAWKLRELKRIKREREAIEAAEKEREEIERRRNLTAEEREREDQEFIAKQKEDREASRGQTGFMQRYFHKGAFFRPDLEKEGLDQRNVMGARFADDVSRETLPQYMQIRDMTKLGKRGRTRYKDLRSEDTGRFGDGYSNRRRQDGPPIGITDERFMPDHGRADDRARGPTGANASAVRERRRSRSRSRTRSPRRDRRDDERDRYRPDSRGRRKRSPSPYEDREKRRRMRSVS
ncbi:splicing factor, Prp19-binding domain-containing protein [Aspergillus carlsbadensis]|nr:splicing factor, Prp19-binding domain-containing protein [Aspergillus carlsbadensis]